MSLDLSIKCPKCRKKLNHIPESKHFYCEQCCDELVMRIINGKITLLSIFDEKEDIENLKDV